MQYWTHHNDFLESESPLTDYIFFKTRLWLVWLASLASGVLMMFMSIVYGSQESTKMNTPLVILLHATKSFKSPRLLLSLYPYPHLYSWCPKWWSSRTSSSRIIGNFSLELRRGGKIHFLSSSSSLNSRDPSYRPAAHQYFSSIISGLNTSSSSNYRQQFSDLTTLMLFGVHTSGHMNPDHDMHSYPKRNGGNDNKKSGLTHRQLKPWKSIASSCRTVTRVHPGPPCYHGSRQVPKVTSKRDQKMSGGIGTGGLLYLRKQKIGRLCQLSQQGVASSHGDQWRHIIISHPNLQWPLDLSNFFKQTLISSIIHLLIIVTCHFGVIQYNIFINMYSGGIRIIMKRDEASA